MNDCFDFEPEDPDRWDHGFRRFALVACLCGAIGSIGLYALIVILADRVLP